jgi:hypothetical protein
VTCPLLLNEMFPGAIAEHLRAKGHDVLAVVADPALIVLPTSRSSLTPPAPGAL